ncbi:MAG: AAA family ATPase, partial [Candidatus Omnitrophica bacterium]|nr:AAA family ATPase [Candidatus Omnitrophota bacterium]
MEIIAVANQKGGCGKTITSVNLAGALTQAGKKVLFIDLDPQGHATAAFGMKIAELAHSTYALFESFLNPNVVISLEALSHKKYDNLWVIGSHISLSTMETKLANVKGAILGLATSLLGEDLSKFDYVIIDTPPNLGFLTLNALHASHRVLVPLDVSVFSLNGVSQIENILALSKSMGFEKPLVNFVLTIFDSRSNFAQSFLEM